MDNFKKVYGRHRSLLGALIALIVAIPMLAIAGKGYWALSIVLLGMPFILGIIVHRIAAFTGFKKNTPNYGDALKEVKAEYKVFFSENLQAMKEKRPYKSPYQSKAGFITFAAVLVLGYAFSLSAPKGGVATNSTTAPMVSSPLSPSKEIASKVQAAINGSSWNDMKLQNAPAAVNNFNAQITSPTGVVRDITVLDMASSNNGKTYISLSYSVYGDLFNQAPALAEIKNMFTIAASAYPEDKADLESAYKGIPAALRAVKKTEKTRNSVTMFDGYEKPFGGITLTAGIDYDYGKKGDKGSFHISIHKTIK